MLAGLSSDSAVGVVAGGAEVSGGAGGGTEVSGDAGGGDGDGDGGGSVDAGCVVCSSGVDVV